MISNEWSLTIVPFIKNLPVIVPPDNVVDPETFNDDIHVVELFNIVNPDTNNDDINVVLYVASVNIAPLKIAGNLAAPSVDVQSNRPVGFKEITEFVAFCANLVLSPMNKQRELSLLRPNNNATPYVEVWATIKYSWPDNKIFRL